MDDGRKGESCEMHECLVWLDTQPERRNVVILYFGSVPSPPRNYRRLPRGLESSGHRFLWAVRSPPEEHD
jgi:hypothetical protein